MTLDEKARTFLSLHRPGEPLVAPSVWDPWSAEFVAGRASPPSRWAAALRPRRSGVTTASR